MLVRKKVGMHGCGSGSAVLVNAEVDSMGGVVDSGVGIGIKTSPRQVAIEKAQAELRLEYDVREERRRELEFLQKGGNPLDFKFGNAASVSVQSTSLTDHHADHFVHSEAKGSFALTASPHGDSVESIGRPGAPTVCEPNTADNFDGENELVEGERKAKQSSERSTVAPLEQSCQMDGTQNAKESDDSAIVRPYARRNRSRPNRDGARSSPNDALQGSGAHGSSSICGGSRDIKELILEGIEQKNQINSSLSIPKFPTLNGDFVPQVETCNNQSNMELECVQFGQAVSSPKCNFTGDGSDVADSNILQVKHDQSLESDAQKAPTEMASNEGDHVEGKEHVLSASAECLPTEAIGRVENEIGSTLPNGFNDKKGDDNEGQNGSEAVGTKDLESSSILKNQGLEVNNDIDLGSNLGTDDANEIVGKQTSEVERLQDLAGGDLGDGKNDDAKTPDRNVAVNNGYNAVNQNHSGSCSVVKSEDEVKHSHVQNEIKCTANIEGREQIDCLPSEANKSLEDDSFSNQESICPSVPLASMDIPAQDFHNSTLIEEKSSAAPEMCPDKVLKVVDRAREDSILEEARMIEAKRKRIAELSVLSVSTESHRKSHWDFVLEEMAWLANDFAQERLWKMTAAAQTCRRVAFSSRLRFEEQNQHEKLKRVAYTLAKAVMQFWQSAETLLNKDDKIKAPKQCKWDLNGSDGGEISKCKFGELDKGTSDEFEQCHPRKASANTIWGYAVRVLRCNCSLVSLLQAEAPTTPDRVADLGITEVSWDDHLTEESLFYAVPSGAMQTYRQSIESHVMQSEKTGSSMQEEVDTSMNDAAADFGYPDTQYNEEEGETSTYYLHETVEGNNLMNHGYKKQKNFMRTYSARSYEHGSDIPFGICTMGSQPNIILGKRPANNYSVGPVLPKRSRTASRQRVVGPFNPGATGALQAPMKTDASSGDTSSFQDDQSTLHGGSQLQKSVEVESAGDFEKQKQLPYDCTETSTKPRKKKKAKYLGSAYEHGWPLDSVIHNEQRDNSKKRLEGHHFASSGTGGLYGQPAAKKPKLVKQPLDSTFDNMAPMTGSIPSPAASQMSNMSNTSKFMRLFNGGRDRGRKAKSQKISAGQLGSGCPWSLIEDQALVVLVHDMGPNWELVSDAINSTLQFKCVFRKPKDCKERHKSLMDKGAGDGADSAEDSGSSQSYPSTLPGIPKGSARQLFQRLQGPMEEDTLKSHFEKIIIIGKKQHYRRSQIDHQDLKPLPPHNSHAIALSQVCPINLNGGFLAPLDLCDASTSSPDVLSLGYPGSHGNNSAIPNQGALAPLLPASGVNASVQGSPGLVLGNNSPSPSPSPSPSGLHNISGRDGRYNVPRTPLPVDEQQRMQHYNQMLSARSLQQPNMSVPGPLPGADRGARILPSGNGMGMMPSMNRNMPISRASLQGMTSSPMLNPGSVINSSMVGVQKPVNLHSSSGSGQGSSMMRPRDTLHVMQPGHNAEHQRQMMSPEHQMQATQGNGQGIPAFNGLSSAYANQTIPPPGQTFSGHQQHHHQMPPQQSHVLSTPHHPHLQGPNHTPASQQQAFAMRLKERQMQQQRLLQQQLAASGALMPHVQAQSQIPVSSSMQNSNQIQPQPSSQAVSLSPLTPSSPMTPVSMAQQQQKHNLLHHGLSRSSQGGSSGLTNQVGKQPQRQSQQQQFQQSGRHHPQQQRQHSESPQHSKALKGMGRGNMMVHQNLPIDNCHLNGLSLPSGNQGSEKGEHIMHLMQGHGVYSGTGLSGVQPSKTSVLPSSNHSQAPQKVFPAPTPPLSKQAQQMSSHSDNSSQSSGLPVTSSHALSSTQAAPSPIMASNHQHVKPQPHHKQVTQAQSNVQRLIQPSRQMNSDMPTKSNSDQGHNQQLMNDVSQISTSATTAIPQSSGGSANAIPVVSPATTQQWNSSETLLDSVMPNPVSQVSSVGSPLLANLGGSEPVVSVNQGLGQRQLSGRLPHHGHIPVSKVITCQPLFHPQEPQLQQEQQQSPKKQLPLQQQPQKQTPHLQ